MPAFSFFNLLVIWHDIDEAVTKVLLTFWLDLHRQMSLALPLSPAPFHLRPDGYWPVVPDFWANCCVSASRA